MSDDTEKYGNPVWHKFIAAAITGISHAAYKKKYFDIDRHDPDHDLQQEYLRSVIVNEAIEIADLAMSIITDRLDEDEGGGWKSAQFEIGRRHGAMSRKEFIEMLKEQGMGAAGYSLED